MGTYRYQSPVWVRISAERRAGQGRSIEDDVDTSGAICGRSRANRRPSFD